MINTLSRQAGRRYPQLHNMPGVLIAALPVAGEAPEVKQITSFSGKVGMRPYLEGKAGVK